MAKKPVQLDENGKRKFGMRDCLAYAAGDLGCNMSFALKSTMALFWTQVMGLSAWYSLLIVISDKPADRASLSAWRSVGSMVGNMLPMVILPFLIYNEDKSLNGPMVFVAALVMGVIGFICFQYMIKNTEVRVDTQHATTGEAFEKFNVIKAMSNFIKNRPAVGATLAAMGMFIGMQAATTAVNVTFQIYYQNPQISGLVSMFAMLPIIVFTPPRPARWSPSTAKRNCPLSVPSATSWAVCSCSRRLWA